MSVSEKMDEKRPFALPFWQSAKPAGASEPSSKAQWSWRNTLRIVGLCVLILCAFSLVDLSKVVNALSNASVGSVVTILVMHIAIVLLATLRFARITRAVGASVPFVDASRLTFGATLANLSLPTSLAGDAGRIWLVRRYDLSLKIALGVGIFDRVIGLAALAMVALIGMLLAPSLIPVWGIVAVCAGCFGMVLLLLLYWQSQIVDVVQTRITAPALLAETTALSIAGHALSIAVVYVYLQDQPVTVSVGALCVLFPVVLVAASLPISVGGWGSRELAAVGVFSLVGLDAASAVALAFMYGVTQTLSAALGVGFFELQRLMRAR